MDVLARNNVNRSGVPGSGPPLVFAHGFGCDQRLWRLVAPHFARTHEVVLFDHVGSGGSDLASYDPGRYGSLDAYADDLIEILDALDLDPVVLVGHSVSAMIGVLASIRRPSAFAKLVLVGPSPRYLDDDDYVGGFQAADIDGLLEALDGNYLGWSVAMAPTIMANADHPELSDELATTFCRTDPAIASQFARATFLADNRADLAAVTVPTLVLQCSDDVIAPETVGRYVHAQIPGSEFRQLEATGHCPNLSAPGETIAAIEAFL